MSSAPQVIVHPNQHVLARAIAARLVTRLIDVQASRRVASVVLTGGGVGTATLAALADAPARDAIDWPHIDLWWGDERFVAAGDAERNDVAARGALLDHVNLDPARVHPMATPQEVAGAPPEVAAERYATRLAEASGREDPAGVPAFDVVLLGVGPDGHVASLFPGQPSVAEAERTVVAVHDAPKPPPTRISLTRPAINAAREVWFLVAGAEKAPAVNQALSGADPSEIPAAGVRGRSRTLWLLDADAAGELDSST